MPQQPHGMRGAMSVPELIDALQIQVGGIGMNVQIDHAWHERPPAEIDARGRCKVDTPIGHFANQTVFDRNADALGALCAEPVEYAGVLQNGVHLEAHPYLRSIRAARLDTVCYPCTMDGPFPPEAVAFARSGLCLAMRTLACSFLDPDDPTLGVDDDCVVVLGAVDRDVLVQDIVENLYGDRKSVV